jgi:anaerobic magnesium-protoporphyrin IX monomethyl ester cyclase
MKRLKVLLIKPYSPADEMIPPVGLGYLATAIRGHHEVAIIDGLKDKLTIDQFDQILKDQQPDICCWQVFTFQIPQVKEYLKIGRAVCPQAKFILGGPHPSASPEDIFNLFPEADWAFKGEAEIGLAKLLDLLAENKLDSQSLAAVPGLIWQDNGRTVVNQPGLVEDLDSLGLPSWDLLRPDTYPLAPHGGFFKNYPIAPIIITRGCPYSCTYCAGHLVGGKKIRFRSVGNVIAEIKLLYHDYGIREIHVEDDNFTFNKNFVLEFCRELKSNNLNISWTCPNGVRLDTLDETLLNAMKDAGLYSISVGIESGSNKILRDMKKSLTKETIKDKIALIKKCGLDISGFFIIGYPTETRQDIMETINFARELPLKRAGFSLFKPFPGTEITKNLIAAGQLPAMSDAEWSKFVLADAIYAPPGLNLPEMKKLRRKAILRFYLRPKIVWKFLSEIKNLKHFQLVLKRTYSWLLGAK